MGKGRDDREPAIVRDFVCTACGCTCDDLTVETDGVRVVSFEPPCPLAEAFLLAERADRSAACLVDGRAVEFEEAIATAAEIFRSARAPLVMGLERATCETQRLAVELVDRLGGFLDPTDERGVSRSHAAVQTVGAVTATLGEVATRSDLVVYWECDPLTTHPRHMDRFASRRIARRVCVVDSRSTPTADAADEYIKIAEWNGLECLVTLRALVRGVDVDADNRELWLGLAEQLKSARYPAVFHAGADEAKTQAITELVRDLHRHTRAVSLPLGDAWNAVGAAQVLTWQTGFPAAVSFARGYPRYLPGEASAESLLRRGEVDAALVVGADPVGHLTREAVGHLGSIPVVAVDDRVTATTAAARVAFHTATFGIETAGSVYRSDGVALPLKAAAPSGAPSAEAVLRRLVEIT